MIQFAFSTYLWGLCLLAVPLILHLLKHRPNEVKPFPSFFFLTQTAAAKQRRNHWLKYLVLFCRCAALACLVLVFAWPFADDVVTEPSSATVLIYDASFSTGSGKARDPMREALSDELNKVTPETPVLGGVLTDVFLTSGDFTGNAGALKSFYEKNPPVSSMPSDFTTALYQADSRLGAIRAKQKKIVVLTDRQKFPWRRFPDKPFLRNADVVEILPGKVQKQYNCSIISARTTLSGLTVRLRNFNKKEEPCTLEVFLDSKQVLKKEMLLPPNGERTEEFPLAFPPEAREGKIVLSAKNDDIPADNFWYFPLNPAPPAKIRLTFSIENQFIREALRSPSIQLETLTRKNLAEPADLLILADLSPLDGDAAPALDAALRNGTGVVLVFDGSARMKQLLAHYGFSFRTGPKTESAGLEMIHLEHPVFREYLKISSASWFDITFFDVPRLKAPPQARILAAFEGMDPAVCEMVRENGKLFVLACPITSKSTNFQTYGNFVAFWRELADYVIRDRVRQESFTAATRSVRTKDGDLDLRNPGNFILKGHEYSVNANRSESEVEQIADSFTCMKHLIPKPETKEEPAYLRIGGIRNYQMLLLLLVLGFLMVELAVSNRTAL